MATGTNQVERRDLPGASKGREVTSPGVVKAETVGWVPGADKFSAAKFPNTGKSTGHAGATTSSAVSPLSNSKYTGPKPGFQRT
jgi:hypothetical protein